ncbi:hypothetical protein TI06_23415, partial [Vibrio vulnificus]
DGREQGWDREGVGAGHDHVKKKTAGIDGGLDAVDHLLLRDDLLVRPMAAALGADLVLDMHRGGAELDHRLHRAGDVERRGA